ncbi:MAG: hypothetical protein QGI09_07985, partial [Dehalococcoidia bacterium]|nr:hypothetical protein [Dehalococcoidia bacterium]
YCTIEESDTGMPRFESNLTGVHIAAIFRWFDEGKSAKEVQRLVGETFHPMSERNVYNYRTRWIKNREARAKDELVVWEDVDRLIASGVAREHLSTLRYVSAWALSMFGQVFRTDPSYRVLKWQSHVMTYTDSVKRPIDIWVLGERFALRETVADHMGKPVERADIDAHLSFRPWEGGEKERRYMQATEQGLVPELSSYSDGDNVPSAFARNLQGGLCRPVMAMSLSTLIPEKRHLLPSQQVAELEKQGKSIPEIRIALDGQEPAVIRFSSL